MARRSRNATGRKKAGSRASRPGSGSGEIRRTAARAGSGSGEFRRDDSPLGRAGRIRASGLTVAAKFSIATSLVVAGSMLIFSPILYRTVAGVMSNEIDEAGMQAVRALSVADLECWRPFHGTVLDGRDAEFEGMRPTVPQGEGPRFAARRDVNIQRAQNVAAGKRTKVLDAVILDKEQERVINGRGAIRFTPSGKDREVDGIHIQEGKYSGTSGSTQARTYTAPVLNDQGEVAGYAVVALSEEKIGKTLGKLLKLILLLAVMFIGVGLLVSWFIGQKITAPIAALTEDIDQVAEGDLEHRTHPHSSDEIGVVARTFDRMTQNLRDSQDLQQKQAAQEHELGVARQVQEALFPEKLPDIEGYESAASSKTAGSVGGNYYDIEELGDDQYLFVLASASGRGIPGAMVITMARSLVQAVTARESSPAAALRQVNAHLSPDLRRGMYVTVLLMRLNARTGEVVVANAGHHPLVLCKKGAKSAEAVHGDGIALGFDKGPIFDRTIQDVSLELEPGDRLVLSTRSLFELKNEEGREFGEAPLYKVFARESAKNSQVFVPMVMHALEEFQPGHEPTEDLAFLTLKRMA